MATTFSAFASQYLNRQHASTLSSSSQPMFFSFTSDAESHHGRQDPDLDDLDDPHLGESEMGHSLQGPQDDEDPYLRLDEDEQVGQRGFDFNRQQRQSMPLIVRSPSPDSPPGWLAHLAHSPQRRRSPSPSASDSLSSDSDPSPDLMVAAPTAKSKTQRAAQQVRVQQLQHTAHPLNPPRTAHSLSLTDSLLPRDGRSRALDVFSLPDPRHTSRARRKYHESIWISIWLGLVLFILLFTIVILFTTTTPTNMPKMAIPYYVLLRTVPMLIILTCTSALVAYTHVYLLRIFVKPVMIATSVFIPATLFLSAIWAFIGSFMWEEGVTPTWGETVGLRLFALIPLALAFITGRRLMHLPRSIHVTSSTLTLTTHLLIANPFLLGLSPAILICALLGSIPFVTLIFRLLLHGYGTKVGTTGWEWHVQAWANWSIFGTVTIWLWSWAIARGVLRMTCASVIGAWYFADPTLPPPLPSDTNTIHAALMRSTGPSFGSIIVASLILTIMRMLAITVIMLRRLPPLLLRIPWVPLSVPVAIYVVPGIRWMIVFLEEKTGRLSRYALIYVGLTGAGFWESATRGVTLVSGAGGTQWGIEEEEEEEVPQDNRGRRARNGRPRTARLQRQKFSTEPPLAMLTVSPLTLTFPFALITYLFVAHTLGAPNEALGAALLAGGVTALVGLFCVGLVKDTADTLYLCYCIDKAAGERRREEVFIAFEYDKDPEAGLAPSRQQQQQRHGTRPQVPPVHRPIPPQHSRLAESTNTRSPLSVLPLTNPKQAKRPETLFEVDAGYDGPDSSDSETDESSPHRPSVPQSQQKQRMGQTPTYLADSSEEGEDYAGPAAASQHRFDVGKDRDDDDDEDDLDPFKKSGMGEEDFGLPVTTKPVTIPPATNRVRGFGAGGTPTVHSPPSAGTTPRGLGGVGLGVGFNVDRRIGGGGMSPATIQIQGRREKERQPGERMLTSTQELNMKSQFLMNMNTRAYGEDSIGSSRHSRSGSGSGGSITASAVGSRAHSRAQSYSLSQAQSLSLSQSFGQAGMGSQQVRESQQSMGSGLTSAANLNMGVSSGMGMHSDDEDDSHQLAPGSDFFK